ncbi:MAG: Transcription termination factor NusA [Candidatus Moranbacteria bacterium GW2011_GWE1_36_7]|nr:MAG: Transcription termination factor NusA [Candidatus Moranbacteria bacterium GW2011_GWD2_36_12]KKQ07195.1 MAG: Transcription termination factor NusA [Candidatus Moranbacteria bacterium GW2011_GWE2_36_40]KKQ15253.1 MAG: Transcription termination factor NusA [Candidatus Moranbacteria bacterium GW2011_GWE1_36_7]
MAKRKVQDESEEQPTRLGEFGSAIMQIAEEKGIPKNVVIETIEAALAAAYKKDYGKRGQRIRAEFNEVGGETKFFLIKDVIDETLREFVEGGDEEIEDADVSDESEDEEKLPRYNPERDILLDEAKKIKKGAKIGDVIEIELEPQHEYGRVAAQTAKQVIIQRIREAERDSMFQEYKGKEGEVVSGTVQRIEGRNTYIDLGKSVGVLFPQEQVQGEMLRMGQRVKVYLYKVESDPKGPGITLSRTHPEMVKKLFELEVPEIFAGTVKLKSIAREAGSRTKIAVMSDEEGIDPIGSCVGQKGTRVQAVIEELGGEKIDIIEWSEKPEKYIAAAISPAKVFKVEINADKKEAKVTVPEDQLSLAIGKRGQNVRLAAKLTGWKIDVIGVVQKNTEEIQNDTEIVEESVVAEEVVEVKEEKPVAKKAKKAAKKK